MAARPKASGQNLFAAAGLEKDAPRPLADKLRPLKLDEVVGQDHLLGMDGAKAKLAELDARMREALAPYDGDADALRALGELAIHRAH